MTESRALIVADPGDAAGQLSKVLGGEGFEVSHRTPDELAGITELGPRPDVVLWSAALGLQRLAVLSQRFMGQGRVPYMLVFPEDDLDELETCVRGGFDYLLPPYRGSLLRSRMSSCWQRWQLTTAVEEMAVAASLREHERELRIAHDIQAGFLPEALPNPPGWEVGARFEPAKQVGGDFYDAFELVGGRRLGFVVADVCDKGVGAALFMALIRTLLRHTAEHSSATDLNDAYLDMHSDGSGAAEPALPPLWSVGAGPLVQAVVGTNRYMARNHLRQAYFATMFFGVLDPATGALLYINGGHNPPLLMRSGGTHTLLQPTGPAVGIMANSTFSLSHTRLDPGDRLLVYTDGVVEARGKDREMFGMDRLVELALIPERTTEEMLGSVDDALRLHVGHADQTDDITMLALRRTPE